MADSKNHWFLRAEVSLSEEDQATQELDSMLISSGISPMPDNEVSFCAFPTASAESLSSLAVVDNSQEEDGAQQEIDTIYSEWCELSLAEAQQFFLTKMTERFEKVTDFDKKEFMELLDT